MTNTKSTKRALISSVLALLVCVSMLIGSTFAWFTDTASSSVNTIQSGKLDVALEMKDENGKWVTAEGTTLKWMTTDDVENVLWEPGCTYKLPELRVVNNGNLYLKYKIAVTGITGDAELLEVIDFTGIPQGDTYVTLAPGAFSAFTIEGHMQESAGNKYQEKTINNIAITVYATQVEAEYDSYGKDYDANAPRLVWDGTADTAWYTGKETEYELSTPEELAGLAQLVNAGNAFTGITVKLAADMDLNNLEWTPIGTTAAHFNGTLDGAGTTIYNLKVSSGKWVGLVGYVQNAASIYNITIDGASVTGDDYVGAVLGGGYLAKDCVAGCTVKNATIIANAYYNSEKQVYDGGAKAGVIAGYAINGNIYNNKAIDSTVYAYRDLGGIVGMVAGENRTVSVYDNTVENVSLFYTSVAGKYDEDKVNGNMNSFAGRTSNATVGTNYGEAVMSSNTVTVASSAAEVNTAIADGKAVVLAKDVEFSSDIANDATVELGGNTLTLTSSDQKVAQGLAVSNGTVDVSKGYFDVRSSDSDNQVVIENVVFNNTEKSKTYGNSTNYINSAVEFCPTVKDAKAVFVFKNCEFNNSKVLFEALSGVGGAFEAVFENCTFNNFGNADAIEVSNYLTADITIKNCEFNITTTSNSCIVDAMSSSDITVTFEGKNTVNGIAAVPTTDSSLVGTVDEVKVFTSQSVTVASGSVDTVNGLDTVTVSGIAKK